LASPLVNDPSPLTPNLKAIMVPTAIYIIIISLN
jgi:hypothetical protein